MLIIVDTREPYIELMTKKQLKKKGKDAQEKKK